MYIYFWVRGLRIIGFRECMNSIFPDEACVRMTIFFTLPTSGVSVYIPIYIYYIYYY